MGLIQTDAKVYLHSSESMQEIKTGTTKLLLGAGVYLGSDANWMDYRDLYTDVYLLEGHRIVSQDGLLITFQTDSYHQGSYIPRGHRLLKLLDGPSWELIDTRIWMRSEINLRQPSISHVLIFRPRGGTASRQKMNIKGKKPWMQNVWPWPQVAGSELNAWPQEMSKVIIQTCTEENDLVVDCFAGTSSLLALAATMHRKAIGYEINKDLVRTIQDNGVQVVT